MVAIVGGGIVGSCAAYFLASEPRFDGRIVVFERDPTYAQSATTLSAASIRQQFSTPVNVVVSQFGFEFLRAAPGLLAVGDDAPEVGLVERSYLYLATSAGADGLRRAASVQSALGVAVRLAEPAELAARYPWLDVSGLALGAFTSAGEGWFDAAGLLQAVRRKAISLGVQYERAQVEALLADDSRVTALRLADGTRLAVDGCLCTAGTRTPALLRTVGLHLPVGARKRTVFWFESPLRVPDAPLVVDPSGFWTRPEGRGWLAGVTPDPDPDVGPDDFERDATTFESDAWPKLARRVPGFEAARERRAWVGHYDWNAFDHNALVGLVPGCANLAFACGFSGHGLQQGPAVGRGLAELVAHGRYVTLDLAALGVDRLARGEPLVETHVI